MDKAAVENLALPGDRTPVQIGYADLKKLLQDSELARPQGPSYGLRAAEFLAQSYLLQIQERQDILRMRRKWAIFIGLLLSIMTLFQIAIVIVVGDGRLDYTAYEWFIQLVIGTNFGQIVGLALIVVKFLFPVITQSAESGMVSVEAEE